MYLLVETSSLQYLGRPREENSPPFHRCFRVHGFISLLGEHLFGRFMFGALSIMYELFNISRFPTVVHSVDKYSDTSCCCRPPLQASSVTLCICILLAKRQWQFVMLLSTEKFCTASVCPKIGKLQLGNPKIDPIQQLTQISLPYCIQFFSPSLLRKFTLK